MVKRLKTPVAQDENGTPYKAEDIDRLYSELKGKRLWSVGLEPVTPRKSGEKRAHFRIKPGTVLGTSLERTERKPTHNETVILLERALTRASSKVRFWSQVFGGGEHEIFTLAESTRYRWKKEPETRYWKDSEKYIQPDLLGWDESRFSPGPRNPTIIIEVVYTHLPEPKTWELLEALSLRNHIVLFFFVRPRYRYNLFNRIGRAEDGRPLQIQVEYYLKEGKLYKGLNNVTPKGISSPEDRYDVIKDKVFEPALAKLKKWCSDRDKEKEERQKQKDQKEE